MKELIVIANDINDANNVAFKLGLSSQSIYWIDEERYKNIEDQLNGSLVVASDSSYLPKLDLYRQCTNKGAIGLSRTSMFIDFLNKVVDTIKLVDDMYYNLTTEFDTRNGCNNLLERLNPTILKRANGFDFKVTRLPNRAFQLIGGNTKSTIMVNLISSRINLSQTGM